MNLNLVGKRALVCGSSQGIGKACAIELASLGASVTLFSRNEERLLSVKSELDTSQGQEHNVLVADFTDPNSVRAAISKDIESGHQYEILINNTGGPAPGLAIDADPSAFLAAFNLHLINNQKLGTSASASNES